MSYFRVNGFGDACPVTAGTMATDRCTTPQPCPVIADLQCVRSVGNIPFEYVSRTARDPQTGLMVVAERIQNHQQKFRPPVINALERFIANMERFGMPISAMLSLGSLYCRCIRNQNTLSDHSFGEAIDIPGVRWRRPGGSPSRFPETLIHNYPTDAGERDLLRRINACLRLSFPLVIDYHHADHDNHFHCDLNRGRGRAMGGTTWKFVQEMLGVLLRRAIAIDGNFNSGTQQALADWAQVPVATLRDRGALNAVLDRLFTHIASGGAAGAVPAVQQPSTPAAAAAGRDEAALVRDALARGVTGINRLTDLVFNARHPELGGRALRPNETTLVREWIDIRNRIVRPLLSRPSTRRTAGSRRTMMS